MSHIHNHHITPKHWGGLNEKPNLIQLTIQDHAIWHYELWVYYGSPYDRIAWKALSGQISISEAKRLARIEGCRLGGIISGNNRKGQLISLQGKQNISEGKIGIKLSPEHVRNVVNKTSKWWIFINPKGKTFIIQNKTTFCKTRNLTPNAMSLVAQGKQSQHKGWTCFKMVS